MMPVNISAVSLRGDGDADLDFHETFPAVMSEKRPKAHGVVRSPKETCGRRLLSSGL
jgi:hypothetical protein